MYCIEIALKLGRGPLTAKLWGFVCVCGVVLAGLPNDGLQRRSLPCREKHIVGSIWDGCQACSDDKLSQAEERIGHKGQESWKPYLATGWPSRCRSDFIYGQKSYSKVPFGGYVLRGPKHLLFFFYEQLNIWNLLKMDKNSWLPNVSVVNPSSQPPATVGASSTTIECSAPKGSSVQQRNMEDKSHEHRLNSSSEVRISNMM